MDRRCKHCLRAIRSTRDTVSDFPGTVPGFVMRSECVACANDPERTQRARGIVKCAHCDRSIRSSSARAKDHPGTVPGVLSRRTCTACDGRKRVTAAVGELVRCQDCNKMTRPSGTRKERYPNTVARYNSSICVSCHERESRGLPYWEINARNLDVPELTSAEQEAATRVIIRSGGDMLVLEALGLKDVYAQVR